MIRKIPSFFEKELKDSYNKRALHEKLEKLNRNGVETNTDIPRWNLVAIKVIREIFDDLRESFFTG